MLNFTVTPRRPEQLRRLRSRQPSLARRSRGRLPDLHDLIVQTFLQVMAYGRRQVLKIATGAAI
jgi:hypothetical protein